MVADIAIFFNKFLGYFKMPNGEMCGYKDKLGYGTFMDERHILWLTLMIIIPVILYQFCKKNKEKGNKLVKILVTIMLIVRIIIQIVNSIMGSSLPHGRDLIPGQMCTILIYLMPLTIIFNWRKINTPIYVLSMMGGFMTFLVNDYFDSRFLNFYSLEGIWAHSMLWCIPLAMIALEEFKLEAKKIWQIIATMLIMLTWAIFLNKVLFKNYNPNYFYLERNMLPNNIGGKYFFFVYVIIFFILLLSIYLIPIIYKKISKFFTKDNEYLKKKIRIITIISIIIISQILVINVKTNRNTKYSDEEKDINLALLMTMINNKSVEYTKEELQKSVESILGKDRVQVYKGLVGIKIKFLQTRNVYNTINAKSNLRATVIRQKVNKVLGYVLKIIFIINVIIIAILIYKNNKKVIE